MTSIFSGCGNQYLPIFETGSQTQIDSLLSQTSTMSESDIKFLMFFASFPSVSKVVFKTVASAVLRWGDQYRKERKAYWLELRRNKKKFAQEIEWAIMDNYILDLMDARLTQEEANHLIGERTPLHHAAWHKSLYANPRFPELAVMRFLTCNYSLDSTKQCSHLCETAWHRACMKADLQLFRTLASETRYGSLHIVDKMGDTPLHKLCGVYPCQAHSPEIAQFLLAHGVEKAAVAKDGKTCTDILIEYLAKTPSPDGEALLRVMQEAKTLPGSAYHD
jgi:hypothetical protein